MKSMVITTIAILILLTIIFFPDAHPKKLAADDEQEVNDTRISTSSDQEHLNALQQWADSMKEKAELLRKEHDDKILRERMESY